MIDIGSIEEAHSAICPSCGAPMVTIAKTGVLISNLHRASRKTRRRGFFTILILLVFALVLVGISFETERRKINKLSRDDQESLLFDSVDKGNWVRAKLCLEAGANPNARGGMLLSPVLLQASMRGHSRIVAMLIRYGAAVDEGQEGIYPVHIAAGFGHKHVLSVLLDSGADVDGGGSSRNPPLSMAISRGWNPRDKEERSDKRRRNRIETVEFLIARGADVNRKGEADQTPLHIAIEHGHMDIVKLLIESGAEINVYRKWFGGMTMLDYAISKDEMEIAKLLRGLGAKTYDESQ